MKTKTNGEGKKVLDENSVAAQGTPEYPLEEHPFWVEDIPYKALRQRQRADVHQAIYDRDKGLMNFQQHQTADLTVREPWDSKLPHQVKFGLEQLL